MLNLKLMISKWIALRAFTGTFELSVEVLAETLANSDVSILCTVLITITFFCFLRAVNSTSNHAILSTVDWLPSIAGFPLKVVNPVHLCSKFPSLPADSVFLLESALVFKFCENYFTCADFHFLRWSFQYILSFPKQTQSNSVWISSESCWESFIYDVLFCVC